MQPASASKPGTVNAAVRCGSKERKLAQAASRLQLMRMSFGRTTGIPDTHNTKGLAMSERYVLPWSTLLAVALCGACSDAYEPTPEHLIGEFSGRAGEGFQDYGLFLAVDQVSDSVRGLWSLSFAATCATHDGPFSGVLDGDQLRLRLQPDEGHEATLDLRVRVLPGDSVLTGSLTLVAPGTPPPGYEGPALCGTDELAPIALHYGEVAGLPIGR